MQEVRREADKPLTAAAAGVTFASLREPLRLADSCLRCGGDRFLTRGQVGGFYVVCTGPRCTQRNDWLGWYERCLRFVWLATT